MLCISVVGPYYHSACMQIEKALPFADVIELCFDVDENAIAKLRGRYDIPFISKLNACTEYTDVAWNKEDIQFQGSSEVIVSYHDYDSTPDDLLALYREMKKTAADIIKIATYARSGIDALRMLCFVKRVADSGDKVIGICMGPDGVATRILAPVVGGWGTFACLEEDERTAPGQLTVRQLVEKYNYRNLSRKTKILGVIGDPVNRSSSPSIHNGFYHDNNIDAVYVPFRIRHCDVEEFFVLAEELGVYGVSVTMPIKEAVVTGSVVNTLAFYNGKVEGYNTDGNGAWDAIAKRISSLHGKRAVIIGAGGAAKAIVVEGKKRGVDISVLNRTTSPGIKGLECMEHESSRGYDILIQCTPVFGRIIDKKNILKDAVIMDIITNPRETQLLHDAKDLGCEIIVGMEMLINQAKEQHKIWFA